MDTPVDGGNLPTEVGQRVIDKPELPRGGIHTDNTVLTEVIEGEVHLKRGTFGDFEVLSDEGPMIGGTGQHPTPMTYLAMATGF